MRPHHLLAATLTLLAAMLTAPLTAAQAVPVAQDSSTAVDIRPLDTPLDAGVAVEVPFIVKVTYPSTVAVTETGDLKVHLEIANQPAWAVAVLHTSMLTFIPRVHGVNGFVVQDEQVAALTVVATSDAPAGALGTLEVHACLEAAPGMMPSCGVGETLLTAAGETDACTETADDSEPLETIESQSAGLASVPMMDMAALALSAVVGAAAGATGVRLARRK